jgi:uncharacterized RDD family membrane protein YckC
MSHDNPFAAPEAEIGTIPEFTPFNLADRGTRFVAAFVDGLIGIVFTLPLMYAFGFFNTPQAAQNVSFTSTIGLGVLGFVFFVLIHGYFLMKNGQTVGKKLTGIRIADLDGGLPSFGRLIGLRYLPTSLISLIPLAGAFYPFLDVLFIFRSDRRCLHDLIAGTQVVKVK